MKTRKIPLRRCVACNQQFDKRDLIRIVNNKEEGISIDLTGKKNGRGAYICRSIDCFELAVKKNALPRALGSQVDEKVSKMIRDEILEGK